MYLDASGLSKAREAAFSFLLLSLRGCVDERRAEKVEFTHSSARIPTCFPLIGESEQKMEASSSTLVEEYFSINDPIKSGVKEGEVPCSSGENSVQMPLHEAAARNDLDRVEALLLSGSSDAVNARDCFGMCPLHHAATKSNGLEVMNALVEAGAAVDAMGGGLLTTPLMQAVRQGLIENAEFLQDRGADVNLREGVPQGKRRSTTPPLTTAM